MGTIRIPRPEADEYAPYQTAYIGRVPEGDVLEALASQHAELKTLLGGLSDDDAGFRYAAGKWSIKQVVGHVCDTERIMAYRAMAFARGEQAKLPGFDEQAYVAVARFDERSLGSLLAELGTVRAATITFFQHLTPEELARRGNANGYVHSVRAFAYVIAGHELHHVAILRERYLGALRPAAR